MEQPPSWSEANSQTFIDYGRYFVPERERQIDTICRLIPAGAAPFRVIELCCGEGLLAEAILECYPAASLLGLDRSTTMLSQAQARLMRFGGRFTAQSFDLSASDWRASVGPARAVVSSLAIHHLDGAEKLALFHDILMLLEPGGALVIADVMQPADERGNEVAAQAWDEAVRQRALELDGNLDGLTLFEREKWNMYRYPETGPELVDKPSTVFEQLGWLTQAGFEAVDVYWMLAGHAIVGGRKPGGDQ